MRLTLTLDQITLIELKERHDALVLACLKDPVVDGVTPLCWCLPIDESLCIDVTAVAAALRFAHQKLIFPRGLLVIHQISEHVSY